MIQRNKSRLATHLLLPYYLLTAYLLLDHYLLLTSSYFLLPTYCSLLTTNYSLAITTHGHGSSQTRTERRGHMNWKRGEVGPPANRNEQLMRANSSSFEPHCTPRTMTLGTGTIQKRKLQAGPAKRSSQIHGVASEANGERRDKLWVPWRGPSPKR